MFIIKNDILNLPQQLINESVFAEIYNPRRHNLNMETDIKTCMQGCEQTSLKRKKPMLERKSSLYPYGALDEREYLVIIRDNSC